MRNGNWKEALPKPHFNIGDDLEFVLQPKTPGKTRREKAAPPVIGT